MKIKLKTITRNGRKNEFVWKNGGLDVETFHSVKKLNENHNDKNLITVFLSLTDFPRSVKTISQDTGVPLTTVYRKIRKLKEIQLVSISGDISDDGIKQFLYSKLKEDDFS